MSKKKQKTEEEQAATQEPRKAPPPQKTSFVKLLPVALTEQEKLELGAKMAKTLGTIGMLERDLKDYVKEEKQKIARLEAEVTDFAGIIRQGYEDRNTNCEQVIHYDIRRVIEVRLDTGEQLIDRPMNDEEAQQMFKFMEQYNKPAQRAEVVSLDEKRAEREAPTPAAVQTLADGMVANEEPLADDEPEEDDELVIGGEDDADEEDSEEGGLEE